MSEINCSICKKSFDCSDKSRGEILNGYWHLCSVRCYKKWWRGRNVYMCIKTMKEIPAWPFDKFKEVFQFGEEGGYAKDKYELAQKSIFHFLCTLSLDKVMIFSDQFGREE